MDRIYAMEYLYVLRHVLRKEDKKENEPFIDAIGYALKDMRKMHLAMLYDDFRHGRDYEEEEADGNV